VVWDDVVFVGVGFVVGNMVTIDDVCERRQWCVGALIGNDDRGSNVVVFAGRFGSVLIKFKTQPNRIGLVWFGSILTIFLT